MKTVLLLFLISLFCVLKAFSQGSQVALPFEDYRKCYTGFKTKQGDTIHPAKFESAYVVQNPYRRSIGYSWIVKERGRFGLLNMNGSIILPSHYDTIYYFGDHGTGFFSGDWLITVLDHRYSLIDFSGKELLPPNYSYIQPHDPWIKVHTLDGNVGLLDSNLHIEVPLEFENISFQQLQDFSEDTLIFHQHFFAKKNGKYGLLRPDLSPILTYEFESIRTVGIYEDFKLNPLYIVAKKEGKFGVYSSEGTLICPHEFDQIELNYDRYQFTHKGVQTATAVDGNQLCFVNVETGARSELFKEIRPYGGKAIAATRKGKWAVIDTNGIIMGSGSKDWFAAEETLDIRDSIVLLHAATSKNHPAFDQVLYHYGTGKFASEPCSGLFRMEIDGTHYCWTQSEANIVIYDAQLRKIKTIEGDFSTISEWLEDDGITLKLPITVLEKEELFGGFDARGNEVIPQIYTTARIVLKDEPHKYMHYKKVADYFEFKNDSLIAYYSLDGALIRALNFNSIYPLNAEFLIATNGSSQSILDLEYNVVLDSCTKIFENNCLKPDWSNDYTAISTGNHKTVFAVRNQKFYMYSGGTFVLTDSSRFQFKNPLQFHYRMLIDRTGSVLTPPESTVQYLNSHYLVSSGDSLLVFSENGGFEFRVDNLLKMDPQKNGLLHLTFNNGFQGIYTLTKSAWIFQPESQTIVPILGNQRRARYSVYSPELENKWLFYGADGQKVSDLALDHGLDYMQSINVVRIEGKMGIMSEDLILLLPAEYDYISEVHNAWFLRKNKKWYMTTFPFTTISEGYDIISTQSYAAGRLVYNAGQVGMIDNQFKQIIPMATEQEIRANYDLASLLIPTKRQQEDAFPIVSNDNPAFSKAINNRIILDGSRFLTTTNDVMPLALQISHNNNKVSTLNKNQRVKYETPKFFSKSYYACTVFQKSSSWGERDYHPKESTNYYNYEWKDGSLVQIDLNDLFNGPAFESHLDSLIIDLVNNKQLYGISCVNLEELLILAKENFILRENGIEFLAMNKNRETLVIAYSELRQFLKRPEEFVD